MKEKLSEIMKRMALSILRNPEEIPSSEAAHAGLLLANIAWNREIAGNNFQSDGQYFELLAVFERNNRSFWKSLKSQNCEELIDELRKFKKKYYPKDKRFIKSCGINERGNIQVIWE